MKLAGCTKGKHRSQHHTDYTYANYFFYMSDLVSHALSYLQSIVWNMLSNTESYRLACLEFIVHLKNKL